LRAYVGKRDTVRVVDVRQIGRDLGVRYILEGSVRKSGQRLRITSQLLEAITGNHIWSERYDRELTDIFAVQDEVTASVTTLMQGKAYECHFPLFLSCDATADRRR
jgi:adenylate cyclase